MQKSNLIKLGFKLKFANLYQYYYLRCMTNYIQVYDKNTFYDSYSFSLNHQTQKCNKSLLHFFINYTTLKPMTSILPVLKHIYSIKQPQQPLENRQIFVNDCLQRIGKQLISQVIASTLIKSDQTPSNRDISLALKKLDEDLAIKMRVDNKKILYRIFGKFMIKQLQNFQDVAILEIQLAILFFKRLQDISHEKTSSLPRNIPTIKTIIKEDPTIEHNNSYSSNPREEGKIRATPNPQRQSSQIQEIENLNHKIMLLQNTFKKHKPTNQSQLNQEQTEDNFNFELTPKDVSGDNNDYCQQFFINIVAYLKNLSSPQGQLTFIWQHLKWQGFETFYEPVLNEHYEWTCTARILFPLNMCPEKHLQRTQRSKNKKKARQLACMDLLKSLYLEYPQVWMIYRHLSQEKKLVIAPLEEPKDQDELAIIINRQKYKINKEKVYKVFRHNKTDIKKMMQSISAKAQLNTLLQQLPGRVTSPKLQKKPVQGFWSVPVRIQYRTEDHIQRHIPPKVYEKTIIFFNAKIAQEQAYMQAIVDLYQENPELFQKIQSIKLAKNIKDAEKKLPLLRNLVQDNKWQAQKVSRLI